MKAALISAKGGRSRPEIYEAALKVEGGDPDFGVEDVERHEHRIRTPPDDGLKLRTHYAAVGLVWTTGLEVIKYWPPLGVKATGGSALEEIRSLCKLRGLRPPAYDPGSRRVVIQL